MTRLFSKSTFHLHRCQLCDRQVTGGIGVQSSMVQGDNGRCFASVLGFDAALQAAAVSHYCIPRLDPRLCSSLWPCAAQACGWGRLETRKGRGSGGCKDDAGDGQIRSRP